MPSKFVVIFVCLIGVLLPSAHAELIIDAIGLADASLSGARELAVDDALRNAIQEGVGVYLESETLVENYVLVEDRILTKTQGFARLLEVLEEGVQDDGLFRLRAKVAVSEGKLEQNLKDIIQANGNPRIMIAAKEDVPHASMIPFTVTKLRSGLLELGYSLVETGNTVPDFGDIEGVAGQALAMGADLALLVDIQATENENAPAVIRNAGFESVFTNMSLNVIEMGSSRVIYSQSFSPATGTAASTADAAIRQAIEGLLPEVQASLVPELSSWLQGAGQADKLYRLTIHNVGSYSHIGALLDTFNTNEGMDKVTMRSFRDGVAEVELEYQGTREGLLAFLENQGVMITGVQDSSIMLEFP